MDRYFERGPQTQSPRKATRDALIVAAIFFASNAEAQTPPPRPFIEDRGFENYEGREASDPLLSRADRYAFLNRNSAATTETPVASQNVESATQSHDAEDTAETITVTALRTEDFGSTENSEFDEDFFDRLGVVSTSNPDLEGLPFLTPEERRDNGWAISVPVLGSREGEAGPFVSLEAGRGHLIAGGVRF